VTDIFLKIINMSITASILVILVIFLRLLLRKAPKWVNVLLWGLVAFRLICPFYIESQFSLMPKSEWITENTVPEEYVRVSFDYGDDFYVERIISESELEEIQSKSDALIYGRSDLSISELAKDIEIHKSVLVPFIFPCVWIVGIVTMLIYMIFSYFRIYRQIRGAKQFRDNIYTSDNVSSPFVFGVIRPRIYLPEEMDAVNMSYVISHEEAHIGRFDHLWKPIGFVLLSFHWFNPLIWIGYVLVCRDIEMACDERVVRKMQDVERAEYSEALLECSVKREMISACPLAFGEIGVKERIKTILNYKKPTFWIILIAVVVCIVSAVCFLTNPHDNEPINDLSDDYYLFIRSDDVWSIEITTPNTSGGCVNADGSIMRMGEKVYLEELASLPDLRGVSIAALNKNGEVKHEIIIPENATDKEIADLIDNDGWLIVPDGYVDSLRENESIMLKPSSALTITDVLTLSKKGKALTWSDFQGYFHTDVGSGLYIWHFEIDEVFSVMVGGSSIKLSPLYIYLCAANGETEDRIEIRDGKVDEFIRKHTEKSDSTESLNKEYLYKVNVSRPDILIHTEPSYDSFDTGSLLEIGTYQIVEESRDQEGITWGKIPSLGWIDVDKAKSDAPHIPLTVEMASENKLKDVEYHEYTVTESEYTMRLLFRSYETITDVSFCLIDITDEGIKKTDALYSMEKMTASDPLVIGVVFWGDLTTYCISFTDAYGNEHQYLIYLSGRNGSLVMQETDRIM